MEDAIALDRALRENHDLDAALQAFESTRIPVVRKLVTAANTSASWYDGFAARLALEPLDFAYSYILRSGRLDDARLRQLCPQFMAAYDSRSH